MVNTKIIHTFDLPDDREIINAVCGKNKQLLQVVQDNFPSTMKLSKNKIQISNIIKPEDLLSITKTFEKIVKFQNDNTIVSKGDILDIIKQVKEEPEQPPEMLLRENKTDIILVHGPNGKIIKPKTNNQREMVTASEKNDILFAIGPAGTGKTYNAVALAVRALKNKAVRKIILTRPAVEAGENLGFLPGDLKDKIDPYLRPLYDALEDMIPADKLQYYMTNKVIEIAPLAYMRGRTLDNAFIILDESQNTTDLQMKMFLTRIGENSKAIITGDTTQVDLPKNIKSGLRSAEKILGAVYGIGFVRLDESDVVRHPLVKSIIKAYDDFDANEEMMNAANQNNKATPSPAPAVN